LHANHFQNGQQGDDHGVARLAGFEEIDEGYGIVVRRQTLAQAVHHLRDGHGFVMQLELLEAFFAFKDLLESFYQINEGDDQLALDFVAGVQRAVGMGPDVIFHLLLLVEQLGGVLEFFMLEKAVHKLVARILLFWTGQRIGGQQHFRLDVNQRSGHVNKIGGHVNIEVLELVKVIEILLGNFCDGNIVDIHLLLAN
jgi:hypothetical protein